MAKLGRHIVPDFWQKILPEDFDYFQIPEAKKSTCLSCPKIKSDNYMPDIKCCTYNPGIVNFLLGQALNDPQTEKAVESLIADGFATPEGYQQTPGQAYQSILQNANNSFGKDDSVVCRFLNDGLCGLYLYRNSICSTFFCYGSKTERSFWDSLEAAVGQIETALGQWTMSQVGIVTKDFFTVLDSLDVESSFNKSKSNWTEKTLKLMWGDWYGREKEFYLKCAELVDKQEHLYEIAKNQPLLQPKKYELALRDRLPDYLKKELDSECPVGGKPMSVEDLWYLLKRAQTEVARSMV